MSHACRCRWPHGSVRPLCSNAELLELSEEGLGCVAASPWDFPWSAVHLSPDMGRGRCGGSIVLHAGALLSADFLMLKTEAAGSVPAPFGRFPGRKCRPGSPASRHPRPRRVRVNFAEGPCGHTPSLSAHSSSTLKLVLGDRWMPWLLVEGARRFEALFEEPSPTGTPSGSQAYGFDEASMRPGGDLRFLFTGR